MSGERLSAAELAVVQALRGLRFGAVEAIVHEGKVVRIERREKLRLEDDPTEGTPIVSETTQLPERPHARSRRIPGSRGSE
ncbi:MAG: YezD family protein [Thermoanaerobaculia bacterium]|jgi:hypothetical protein|nr:YezD family protein [Thermoanaerobaculia bacterium]